MAILKDTIVEGNLRSNGLLSTPSFILNGTTVTLSSGVANGDTGLVTAGQVKTFIQNNTITPTRTNGVVSWTSGWVTAGSISVTAANLGLTQRTALTKSGGTVSIAANSWNSSELSTTVTASDLGLTQRTALTIDQGTISIPANSWNSSALTATDVDLIAENIRLGVDIFGVVGTLNPNTGGGGGNGTATGIYYGNHALPASSFSSLRTRILNVSELTWASATPADTDFTMSATVTTGDSITVHSGAAVANTGTSITFALYLVNSSNNTFMTIASNISPASLGATGADFSVTVTANNTYDTFRISRASNNGVFVTGAETFSVYKNISVTTGYKLLTASANSTAPWDVSDYQYVGVKTLDLDTNSSDSTTPNDLLLFGTKVKIGRGWNEEEVLLEVDSPSGTRAIDSVGSLSSNYYLSSTDISSYQYVKVKAGSATTPTASGVSTSTSLSGTTLTVSRSVTPTISAGWIPANGGTAGTVTITGTVPTETKSLTTISQITTINPTTGKLIDSIDINLERVNLSKATSLMLVTENEDSAITVTNTGSGDYSISVNASNPGISLTDANSRTLPIISNGAFPDTLTASNIASGVTIFGIQGTHSGGITPSGTHAVDSVGSLSSGYYPYSTDISAYQYVKIKSSVWTNSTTGKTTVDSTITPSTSAQYFYPSTAGWMDANRCLKVNAISTETKTASAAGDVTPTSGYYLTKVTVPSGSATTPTASAASTSTSLSGTTITVARSVTPSVSAGWVASGTAGTVTITATVPNETKTASASGDVTPTSGKLLTKVTVPAGVAHNAYVTTAGWIPLNTDVYTLTYDTTNECVDFIFND